PYKDPSAVFIQLIENIAQTAQRVGGTAELQIGEGKQDAPVGTTLAMIEQATKLMSAVHKRLHQAQGQEFDMLKSMLMEDPSALWRHNKKSKVLKALIAEAGLTPITDAQETAEDRQRQLFLTALADCELMPAADPNTSSQTERYLKVVAMRQMAQTNQALDLNEIDKFAFQVMGVDDSDRFFKPPQPAGAAPPDPQQISAQANVMTAQARLKDSQNKTVETQAKIQQTNQDLQNKQQEIQSREKIAALDVARTMVVHGDDHSLAQQSLASDNAHQNADRAVGVAQNDQQQKQDHFHQSADRMSDHIGQAQDQAHGVALAKTNNSANAAQAQGVAQQSAVEQVRDQAHDLAMDAQNQQHEMGVLGQTQQHEATQKDLDRQHQIKQAKA
ncbi:MAG TPA: hypothetical protein VK832_14825, partial [Burkholderiaceae bacterium]|nr:hypothetical protein [Burkholderiaceae bacterium]